MPFSQGSSFLCMTKIRYAVTVRCNAHVVLGTVIFVIVGVTANPSVQLFIHENVLIDTLSVKIGFLKNTISILAYFLESVVTTLDSQPQIWQLTLRH